jgi:membrane protein YdbS with pleckstrin-like domain
VGYVERHLLPRERLLYTTRLHWILFAKPVLTMLAGVALTWVLYSRVMDPPWLWQTGVVLSATGVLWLAMRWIEWETSEFAVTSVRLIFKVGLIARYSTELLLSKVESISVTQGPVGRLANYGDLTVTGTGAVREVFTRVHDPVGFRNAVQLASSRPGHE